MVVALVGMLSVWGTVAAAVFFGGLQSAILFLPIVTDLPPPALVLLHGMVAFLVTVKFRAVRRRPAALAAQDAASAVSTDRAEGSADDPTRARLAARAEDRAG